MAESKIKPLRIDYEVVEGTTTDNGVINTGYSVNATVSLYVKEPNNCIATRAYNENAAMLRVFQYNYSDNKLVPLASQDVTIIMGIKRY